MSKRLNRDLLKFLVIIPMTLSHFGDIFLVKESFHDFPFWFFVWNVIGYLTAPVMCVLMVKGYEYTRFPWKYTLRVACFALISYIPHAWSHNSWSIFGLNMFFTFSLWLVAIICYDKIPNKVLRWICILAIMAVSALCEWPFTTILWLVSFYAFRNDPKKKLLTGILIYGGQVVILSYLWHEKLGAPWKFCIPYHIIIWGVVAFALWLAIYVCNGKRGKHPVAMKWFFYLYYPLHFAVFGVFKYIL